MAPATDLLRVENLAISFSLLGGKLDAVRRADLRVLPGKVTALVGESGSGKSVISQAIMGILPQVATASGKIVFHDAALGKAPVDLLSLPKDGREMLALRGARIGMIFQEPMTSLSPLHTIGNQISEVLTIHTGQSKAERRDSTEEMLGLVGFKDPKRAFDMYPFELSGGMRQRAMIAMALICRPALLIADEPTTALDVTTQAEILDLIKRLQVSRGMAMLLITHDMGIVAEVADDVAVMRYGRIVESGPVDNIFHDARHPYTQRLLNSTVKLEGNRRAVTRSAPAAADAKPVLSVRNLSKLYGASTAWFGTNRNAIKA
ncbi:MAG: ABC transporter ATP-binding protein, partial [Alphaproteobacteria bacterium]